MPYELTEIALTAAFVLIWAFIGLTMLRDQLLTIRRQRMEEGGAIPAPLALQKRRRTLRSLTLSAGRER